MRALDRKAPGARAWWDSANYPHVWGSHEARLDRDAVKARVGDVRNLLEAVKKLSAGD